jgi:hypothetical protein
LQTSRRVFWPGFSRLRPPSPYGEDVGILEGVAVIVAMAVLHIYYKWQSRKEVIAKLKSKRRYSLACSVLLWCALTAGVLAIATDFHYMRLLSIFTVLTAILAVLFGRAITSGMCALVFLLLSHKTTLLSEVWYF